MSSLRRNHSASFKAKVALEALKEQETMAERSKRYEVHAHRIYKWRRELVEQAESVFSTPEAVPASSEREEDLLRKIGELTVERNFCHGGSRAPRGSETRHSVSERRDPSAPPPCEVDPKNWTTR